MTTTPKSKQDKIKELIVKNPTLSGNKIYQESKKKGFGIRKTDFYDLFREVKKLPETTLEKRTKSIPTIYKKAHPLPKIKIPKTIEIPTKKGNYGVVELHDEQTKTSKWIKYKNKKDLDRQVDIIDESDQKTGAGRIGYKFKYHGVRSLTEFIDQEFEQYLNAE